MSDTANTRNSKNRKMRQEALREQLQANGHLSQVIENIKKLQDESIELDQHMISRLKIANDSHHKLIDKYLASLKQVEAEVSGDMGLTIKVMNYAKSDSSE